MTEYDNADDMDDDNDSDLIDEIQKNIYEWYSYFGINYENGENDKQFTLMTQWSNSEQESITRLGLPYLQFNKLYDTCKKIISDARLISPSLQVRSKQYVSPDDDEANIDMQKRINIMQNFLRNLAYNSQAQIAYQTAFENAIYSGYGAIHIEYEYEDAKSFDRKITVKAVPVAEKAFFDPIAATPTKTDGNFCGVYYTVDKGVFEKIYPDIKYPESFPDDSPQFFYWEDVGAETITIVDYYCKKWVRKSLVLLDNGVTVEKEKLKEYEEMMAEQGLPAPSVVDEREADDFEIWHYKCIRDTILEKNLFPSKILPVIYMDGDSYIWRGQQYTQSFVRQAIDAQRFLNYTGLAIAQGLKNARKEQFLVTADMVKGYEYIWQNPELYQGALMHNWDTKAGKPEKLPPCEIPQSLYQNYERAGRDIQSILGVYDAALGAPTAEISGTAINAKAQQGHKAAGVFRDNLLRAIEDSGRCILSMVPSVYDTERTISLLKHDGTSDTARINEMMPDGSVKNDLREDIFDLSVEAGASYEVQKQTALDLLTKLVAVNPQTFPLVADIMADNMDIINRPQLVERLRTLVPPNILAKEKGEPPPPPPPPTPPSPQDQLKQAELQLKQQKMQSEQMIDERKLQLEQQRLGMDAEKNQLEKFKIQEEAREANQRAHIDNTKAIAEMYRAEVQSQSQSQGANIDNIRRLAELTGRMTTDM